MLNKGPYKPQEHESKIYQLWEKGGYFKPEVNKDGEPYCIMMPPANVTGTLHLGHALTIAIEDILIRYHRMQGDQTLWLPGTDHAAIATQSKVEKILYQDEKKTRQNLGREKFLQRVEEFAQNSHDTIIEQSKRIGASCDWSREAYTLDEKRNLAVRTAFKKMYYDGLIYRGYRVVNWDTQGQTVVSDDEVIHKERKAEFYTFKYSKDFPIPISTTRPETKVGDTAVAVHTDDKRYKKYIGQEFDVDFCGVAVHIKVIADKEVDPEFGTGALGVTPAHSQIDWEIAQRHDLPLKQVINEEGQMTVGDKILNKSVEDARKIIVDWLKANDLLIKQESISQNVMTAERTGGIIEPLPKKQWFIDVNKKFKFPSDKIKGIKKESQVSLKELMKATVESDQIKIIPKHFDKTYFHWIENLRDWCISRQIWYGHQIPVWYKGDEIYCDVKPPSDKEWQQDSDTLDTWFSSGLWTFSTLGWPENTKDLKTFHPTSVLETGYDILFFWVARMILMTTYLMGEIPFEYVFLHGLVRDEDKKKMSKSSGNMVDPLGVTGDYGTDALRMALVFGTGQGSDIAMSMEKVAGQKKFANKIWNASKFVLSNIDKDITKLDEKDLTFNKDDKKILEKLDKTVAKVTKDIDNFMFHEAAQDIYSFFWYEFCDKCIEKSKARLSSDDKKDRQTAQFVLYKTLSTSLKLLHPFMPFITEAIYQELPNTDKKSLIVENWPK